VRDDHVIADWTQSDPQARGPINATFVVTAAATYSALLHIISADTPLKSGTYRLLHLVTTPPTTVNLKHTPPSLSGYTETHPKIQTALVRRPVQDLSGLGQGIDHQTVPGSKDFFIPSRPDPPATGFQKLCPRLLEPAPHLILCHPPQPGPLVVVRLIHPSLELHHAGIGVCARADVAREDRAPGDQ